MSTARNFIKLFVWIILCELVGMLGSIFTFSSVSTWYAILVKPALNPPAWLFGPVWTVLYALMGVAGFLVYQKGKESHDALKVFGLQLFLNAIWSPIFFGLHRPDTAFLVIVLMWTSIVWTMVQFSKHSKIATVLLVPYLLWVSFATYLNLMLWLLN